MYKINENNVSIYIFIKRFLDIILSLVAIIVTLPITFITSLAIIIDDRGPIFYHQTRVGKNGKRFEIFKFRSMIVNADSKKKDLQQLNEVNGAMFKISHDPRVTNVGHFIRKHSIDELPQLINVLMGDMSLVGPRPPLPEELEKYSTRDMKRLTVKPGCTGLWQVSGRNALDFDEMVDLDLKYIQHEGFILDAKICLKTIWIMIDPNDAY